MRFKFALSVVAVCAFVAPASAQTSAATLQSGNPRSWVAGGQLGYNWQRGAWVYGVETDLSGTRLSSASSGALDVFGNAGLSAKTDWYGTARGRLGWGAGSWLIYGTGGLAYGSVTLGSNSNVDFGFSSTPNTLVSQNSSVRTGWVAGGGFEYLLSRNLRLGVGYQYVDLNSANLSSASVVSSQSGTVALAQNVNARAAFQVIAASLNWQFSAATAGAPWQGGYFGGRAGGAFGNGASGNFAGTCDTCFPLLSDARLKTDIVLVGHLDDGLGLYRYRYVWSDTVYVGVMAQEVALRHPDAVVRSPLDDYLRVDYSKLGWKLMTEAEWDAFTRSDRLHLAPRRASL